MAVVTSLLRLKLLIVTILSATWCILVSNLCLVIASMLVVIVLLSMCRGLGDANALVPIVPVSPCLIGLVVTIPGSVCLRKLA